MDLVVFNAQEIVAVLRALRGVASANECFTDAEAAFVETVGRLHGVTVDAHALPPISVEEVAAVVVDPHRRKRAVQLAIVTSLIEGEPDPRGERAVAAMAAGLGIEEQGLRVVANLVNRHSMLARLDMTRRVQRVMTAKESLWGIIRLAIPVIGAVLEDSALTAKFEALSRLPQGTLGYALYHHYADNGFASPGARGGFPEGFMFHDVGHVLSGYGVDPAGEIQQAAFQAGFMRHDGFCFLLFSILQFHLGLRLTPVAERQTGLFDPELVLRAAARGAACKVDISDGFDLWAHAAEPLDEVRAELGISPLSSPAGRAA